MQRIREVFRSEYIGAITIGLVLTQAVTGIVGSVIQPLLFYLIRPKERESVWGGSTHVFPWSNFVIPLVSIGLYLLVAYLLLYWLYFRSAKEAHDDEAPAAAEESDQP